MRDTFLEKAMTFSTGACAGYNYDWTDRVDLIESVLIYVFYGIQLIYAGKHLPYT